MLPIPRSALAVVASLVAGIFLAIMMRINASLGEIIGPLESSFIVHLIGALFALLLVIRHLHQNFAVNMVQMKAIPIKLYSCGLYGVILVLMTNIIVPQLGMILTVAIVITCSLVSSVLADHIGLLQPQPLRINPSRFAGILCAIGGLLLVLKG